MHTCPLCQQANNCQSNQKEKTCWCMTYLFPEPLRQQLENTPSRCICSTCAQSLGAKKRGEVIHKK